jgi:hypothetical protein
MLPDLRFVFGALMVIAITGMIGVGLFVSAQLFHQAKMGPTDSRRNLAFTDRAEWNQFYEPGSVRRFVGLARQGEAREIGYLPPEHRPQAPSPAPLAVDLAPVEVAEQDDGVEAAPLSVRPSEVAENATANVAPPPRGASTVAAPSVPDQADEAPVSERAASLNADNVMDTKPGPAEAVVVHAVPMPVHREPSAAGERPASGRHIAGSTDGSAAAAIAVEAGNRSDRGPSNTMPIPDDEVSEAEAVTGMVETATAAVHETTLPQQQKAPPQAAPHPPAAGAKAVAPAARAPAKRATRDDGDEDERPRAANSARPRTLASRPRTAPQAYAPRNGRQRVDPRQPPPGQPVFGPHFPYATPQSRQPVFGPHFPYATPQARRPRQPSYGPAYGWR